MKKITSILVVLAMMVSMTGCGNTKTETEVSSESTAESSVETSESESSEEASSEEDETPANGEATILYTNDVHGYINNTVKDDDGNEKQGLSYASVKAMKDELESEGKNVLLVDDGDHIQGNYYAGISKGEEIIELMNLCGYDLATLGNHEFDYGCDQIFSLIEEADFDYVSCSFYTVSTEETVLAPYKVLEAGDLKIAFIGISTPESMKCPAYFMDDNGEYLYNFYGATDVQKLYDAVQESIDAAKEEADLVIALGHLGVQDGSAPHRSIDVIANTSGLDAFIDGHSHTVMPNEIVKDKDGNDVVVTQTGSYFSAIGQMDISVEDGEVSISTSLIEEYDERDETVQAAVDEIVEQVNESMSDEVSNESVPFYISDPETGERLVRKQDTNLSDLVADSTYWYFNDVMEMDCDLTIINGGGVRVDCPNGIRTLLDCKSVEPFGNVVCMIEADGQTIKDALEHSMRDLPGETSFYHVAGLRYTVDTSVECTEQLNDDMTWKSGPTGEYRVQGIEVYNKETGEYEPLELDKTYRVGGINYILRNGGNGMTMFMDCSLVIDYVGEDADILAQYVQSFKDGVVSSENSPLAAYKNYPLDYENPYGSGRITIK